jgi:hypothetical protein
VTFWGAPCELEKPSLGHQWRLFLGSSYELSSVLERKPVVGVFVLGCGSAKPEMKALPMSKEPINRATTADESEPMMHPTHQKLVGALS